MEEQTRIVVYSQKVLEDISNIYDYGCEVFSPHAAEAFIEELLERTDALAETYMYHTECRYLPTKSRKYRTLVFYAYMIIYRISEQRIEVLTILHSSQNISMITKAKAIKIP